jgi:hypothetical protein
MIGKHTIKLDKSVESLPGFNRGIYYNPSDLKTIRSIDEIENDEPYKYIYIYHTGEMYLPYLQLWDGKELHMTKTLLY